MIFILGEAAYVSFTTNDSTGAAINADSLPTAVLVRNGAVDGAVTVAVANLSTGAYVASFTVPGGYSVGDDLEVLISATVDSIAAKLFKGHGKVDSTTASRAVAGDAMTLADDAITSAKVASSAVAEIQSGLSTLDAAGVRTAVGLASANLDTQLASLETNTNDLPTLIENDGLGTARFTAAALAQSPVATVIGGENTLTSLDTGTDGVVGLFLGDRYSLVLKAMIGGAPPPASAAIWTASTTDEATGAAIATDVDLTTLNEALGYFSYPLAAGDTVSARRVKLTLKRVAGSDVRVFGPLVLNVRDR